MIKRKILKTAKGKKSVYRKAKIGITADFLSKAMQARRQWNSIFEVPKKKNMTTWK